MEEIKQLPSSFEELLESHEKPILVDFWAEWCPPCKMMNPVINQIAKDWKEKVTVVKINTDEKAEIASKYNISSIPTLILFKKGKEVKRSLGAMSLVNLKNIYEQYL
ncbi:MAG: thioredoxin [Spirochaetia bacterium]|nr:thioredoxin [Spirochaetia bacterium]